MYARVFVCVSVRVSVFVFVSVHVHVHVRVYVRVHVRVHMRNFAGLLCVVTIAIYLYLTCLSCSQDKLVSECPLNCLV